MHRTVPFALLLAFTLSLGGLARAADAPPPADAPAPPPPADADAAARKAAWLSSEFRCRAISTTRMRTCRIEQKAEQKEGRPTLTFPVADVTCVVEFGEDGNPTRLVECGGGWVSVPKTAKLTRAKKQPIWTGSRSGWRWKEDGQEYCCPGMWLEAPKALR